MTVRDLIAVLQTHDPDALVLHDARGRVFLVDSKRIRPQFVAVDRKGKLIDVRDSEAEVTETIRRAVANPSVGDCFPFRAIKAVRLS